MILEKKKIDFLAGFEEFKCGGLVGFLNSDWLSTEKKSTVQVTNVWRAVLPHVPKRNKEISATPLWTKQVAALKVSFQYLKMLIYKKIK